MYWNRQLHSFSPPNTSERPSTVEPTTEKPTTEEPTPTDQCGVSGTPCSKISIYIKSNLHAMPITIFMKITLIFRTRDSNR